MKKSITICPRCKSTNVQKEMSIMLMVGAPQQWLCLDCGFKSHFFPEIYKEPKKE